MEEPELTIDQACEGHLLTTEDFKTTCNEDGTVKKSNTTTLSLRNDDSKSITVNTTVLQGALIGVTLVAVVLAVVIFRRIKNKK